MGNTMQEAMDAVRRSEAEKAKPKIPFWLILAGAYVAFRIIKKETSGRGYAG